MKLVFEWQILCVQFNIFSGYKSLSILADAKTKMEAFADERKFAAWAGVAPGNNESAGKKKDQNAEEEIRI